VVFEVGREDNCRCPPVARVLPVSKFWTEKPGAVMCNIIFEHIRGRCVCTLR